MVFTNDTNDNICVICWISERIFLRRDFNLKCSILSGQRVNQQVDLMKLCFQASRNKLFCLCFSKIKISNNKSLHLKLRIGTQIKI